MFKRLVLVFLLVLTLGCSGKSDDGKSDDLQEVAIQFALDGYEMGGGAGDLARGMSMGLLSSFYNPVANPIQVNRETCLNNFNKGKGYMVSIVAIMKKSDKKSDRTQAKILESQSILIERFCGKPKEFDTWFNDNVIAEVNNRIDTEFTIDQMIQMR